MGNFKWGNMTIQMYHDHRTHDIGLKTKTRILFPILKETSGVHVNPDALQTCGERRE